MESHDNKQQPIGATMKEGNQTDKQDEKPVTLGIDIWYLVFKQVIKIYRRGGQSSNGEFERKFKKWLLPFRLLSRDFYDVITPIVYYHVDLERGSILTKLVWKTEPLVSETFEENILNHTREMVLASYGHYDIYHPLDLQTAAAKLVAKCRHLKSLMWVCSDRTSHGQLASLYLHSFLQNTRGCHYFEDAWINACYIKELNLEKKSQTDDSRKSKTTSIESNQALANRANDLRLRSTSTTEIKASLGQRKARPELEALMVDLTGAEFRTFKPFGAKFPAMESLRLRGYTWDHAQSNVEQVWNFTRLRGLSLVGGVVDFLKVAPINQLAQLHFLGLSGFPVSGPGSTNDSSVPKLLRVLLERLKDLNKLAIVDDNWDVYTPMDAVFALGSNLMRLELRQKGYSFFVYRSMQLRVISVAQLVQLRISRPNLVSLCLDLSVFSREVEEFLTALSQFEQLRALTLHAVSSLAPQGVSNGPSDDADYDGAQAIMTKLHAQKFGFPFYWIEIHLHYKCGPLAQQINLRSFASQISVSGVYEQWGSSRKVDPRVLVGSASN